VIGEHAVELSGVSKRYLSRRGTVDALVDLSLSVRTGGFVSLVGRSGCGKTTTLKMIAGLIRPTSGSIVVAGQPVDGPVGNLGMVFQTPNLLGWRSVLANVLLPAEILRLDRVQAARRARQLLDMVGLSEFVGHHPGELSGGMQQRVALARALVTDPPLLLMDEPFAALDAMTRHDLRFELLDLWGETGKTIVFVTHDIEEALLLSDEVVVLGRAPGRLVSRVVVDLARPRRDAMRFDASFSDLVGGIRRSLDLGVGSRGTTSDTGKA
jgi:NitT/TauT family transport system ATP-binding protein